MLRPLDRKWSSDCRLDVTLVSESSVPRYLTSEYLHVEETHAIRGFLTISSSIHRISPRLEANSRILRLTHDTRSNLRRLARRDESSRNFGAKRLAASQRYPRKDSFFSLKNVQNRTRIPLHERLFALCRCEISKLVGDCPGSSLGSSGLDFGTFDMKFSVKQERKAVTSVLESVETDGDL